MLDIICFRLSSFSESLKFLDLSNNDAKKVLSNCFDHLPVLKMLLLKCNRIEDINPNAFGGLSQVFMLDLSGNKLVSLCSTFYEALEIRVFNITDNSFQEINFGQLGNLHLDVIATDDYRICCLLLESETICTASPTWPQNCNILLHDTPAEIFDIVFALVATTVNIAGIVWGIVESIKMKRTKFQMVGSVKIVKKENKSLSFVTNIIFLHTNDLIFGVYLLIIFACSKLYEKNYPVESPNWLQSPLCKVLSCIFLLGLINSLLVVHLLTISRLFATKYPFKSTFKNTKLVLKYLATGTVCTCVISALFVTMYTVVEKQEKLPSSLCILVGRTTSSPTVNTATILAASLQVGFFISICIQYGVIVQELTKPSDLGCHKNKSNQKSSLLTQFFLVTASNALCWFPSAAICVATLVMRTYPIQLLVWNTILIIPLNCIMNPVIYSLIPFLKKSE